MFGNLKLQTKSLKLYIESGGNCKYRHFPTKIQTTGVYKSVIMTVDIFINQLNLRQQIASHDSLSML